MKFSKYTKLVAPQGEAYCDKQYLVLTEMAANEVIVLNTLNNKVYRVDFEHNKDRKREQRKCMRERIKKIEQVLKVILLEGRCSLKTANWLEVELDETFPQDCEIQEFVTDLAL